MEKQIKIKILSKQYEIPKEVLDGLLIDDCDEEDCNIKIDEDLLAAVDNNLEKNTEGGDGIVKMVTDGYFKSDEKRVEISYSETELTGMEGAVTSLSFDIQNPSVLTMLRGGTVTTAMVFEPNTRHMTIYETPYMPFEICISTISVANTLLVDGKIKFDYIVEIKGAQAERTSFSIEIEDISNDTSPLSEYAN